MIFLSLFVCFLATHLLSLSAVPIAKRRAQHSSFRYAIRWGKISYLCRLKALDTIFHFPFVRSNILFHLYNYSLVCSHLNAQTRHGLWNIYFHLDRLLLIIVTILGRSANQMELEPNCTGTKLHHKRVVLAEDLCNILCHQVRCRLMNQVQSLHRARITQRAILPLGQLATLAPHIHVPLSLLIRTVMSFTRKVQVVKQLH